MVLEIVCIEVDGVYVMTVNQCLAMNFRHGTGIMHMDSRHSPLSDKSDPPPLNLLATAL